MICVSRTPAGCWHPNLTNQKMLYVEISRAKGPDRRQGGLREGSRNLAGRAEAGPGTREGAGEDAGAEDRGPGSRAVSGLSEAGLRTIRAVCATRNPVRQYLTMASRTRTLPP